MAKGHWYDHCHDVTAIFSVSRAAGEGQAPAGRGVAGEEQRGVL